MILFIKNGLAYVERWYELSWKLECSPGELSKVIGKLTKEKWTNLRLLWRNGLELLDNKKHN
jgi:hypothetical protein